MGVSVVKAHTENPFVAVSKTVIFDKSLTAIDKSVYVSLCSFMNYNTRKCMPSRKTIRSRARVSEATLTKSLRALEERGYISIENRFKIAEDGGETTVRKTSNEYYIFDV